MKFKILVLLMLFLVPGVLAVSDSSEDVETEINIVFNGTNCELSVWDETGDSWEYELEDCEYDEQFNKTLNIEFERDFECDSDKMCKVCEDLDEFQKDCTAIYSANTEVSSKLVACEEREKGLQDYKTKFDTCTLEKSTCITDKANFEKDADDCEDENQNDMVWLIAAFGGGAGLVYFTQVKKPRAKSETSQLQPGEPRKVVIND